MSRNPLFQVTFTLQNTPDIPELRLGDVQLYSEMSGRTTSKFDLAFNLTETAQGLHGSVEYNTDLYKEDTIVRMIGHYKKLLSSIVTDPQQKIAGAADAY